MMSPGDEFLLVFPSWVIVNQKSVVTDDSGKPVNFKEKAMWYYITVNQERCIPVFTDDDLCERHIRENNINDCVLFPIANAMHFLNVLRGLAKNGFSAVVFDVGKLGGTVTCPRIPAIIDSLERAKGN